MLNLQENKIYKNLYYTGIRKKILIWKKILFEKNWEFQTSTAIYTTASTLVNVIIFSKKNVESIKKTLTERLAKKISLNKIKLSQNLWRSNPEFESVVRLSNFYFIKMSNSVLL